MAGRSNGTDGTYGTYRSRGLVSTQFGDFGFCQAEIHGANDAVHLFGIAGADYSAGYGRVTQCPGDRGFAWGAAVAGAYSPEAFHQFKVFG